MILFGIEQEHFIFGSNGEVPSLVQMGDCFRFLETIGYRISSLSSEGIPLSANLDYESGYVSVKNDFCTHIIEFALPPVSDPSEFSAIYLKTQHDIELALKSVSLQILKGSTLPAFPSDTVFIPGHERLNWFMKRPLPANSNSLTHRYFTTMMAATQVHLNISSAKFYQFLPSLYALDVIAPLLFTNGTNFNGEMAYCPRVLAWCQNLPESYLAAGHPHSIPNSETQYSKMIKDSADFQRDYSFISPRQSGSVEFRSACSQNDLESVLQLIALRIGSVIAGIDQKFPLVPDRTAYLKAALTGEIQSRDQLNAVIAFNKATSESGSVWKTHLQPVIEKLTGKIKHVA